VKLLVLVAVPPGVVTEISPVVAPLGTVAVTCVAELTVNVVALVPLNVTAVAPVKFVPVITTEMPTEPLVGAKLVIVGDPTTVKLLALVAVPPGVVTAIDPVVAPVGTVAVIWVAESTENVVALVPLNVTAVAPVKFVPVITTLAPTAPLAGEKFEIVGGETTVKAVALVAEPPGVVTETRPVVAPAGTAAVIWVAESTENVVALVPLNVTAVAPVKFIPVMTTLVPTGPLAGLNPVMVTFEALKEL
jgi:hypothetical protein